MLFITEHIEYMRIYAIIILSENLLYNLKYKSMSELKATTS